MKNKTTIFYDFEATSVSRDADCISVGLVAVTEKTVVLPNNIVNGNSDLVLRTKKEIEIKTFYAEFTDFEINKCDDWVKENVVGKLRLGYLKPNLISDVPINGVDDVTDLNNIKLLGTTSHISTHLKEWLSQFESIEFWADFDVIDKPMLIDLIADWDFKKFDREGFGALINETFYTESMLLKIGLPKHLYNIKYDQFFDLHTLFKIKGIDTDISREEFAFNKEENPLAPIWLQGRNKHTALYDAYVSYLCYKKLMSL
jgi:hypothetical protein